MDPVFLLEEEQDAQARDKKIFGHAHAACLKKSAWQEFWFTRHLHNLKSIRNMPMICLSDNTAAAWNEPLAEILLLTEGSFMYIPLKSLAFTKPGIVTYQVGTVAYWDIKTRGELVRTLQQAFINNQSYSLPNCLDCMLDDKSRSNYANLQSGEMKPSKSEPESTLETLEDGWFEGDVTYPIVLHQDVSSTFSEIVTGIQKHRP